jgi:hypothetical protein
MQRVERIQTDSVRTGTSGYLRQLREIGEIPDAPIAF